MTTNPTIGATESTGGTWAGRPVAAWTLRFTAFVAPIALSWSVTHFTAPIYWRPFGAWGALLWVAQLITVGSATVMLAGRLTRRLLPLAALYGMSLVFPDRAPSRFHVALRSGTVKNMQARLAEVEASDFGADSARSAALIVELVADLGRHERMTRGHTERVRAYTDLIAEEMSLPQTDRDKLRWACLMHDIGKLYVPAEILNKAGKPTAEEWALLAQHPVRGGEIVEPLAGWLGEWRFAASQHHERWDGKGYPLGLAGREISLAGRIVAVADAYDVITSARSYKKPMSHSAARQEMVRCAGGQFDPDVVRAFLHVSIGRTTSRAGVLGWLIELPGALGSAASQVSGAAGGVVAATAMATMAAVAVTPPTPTADAATNTAAAFGPAYVAGTADSTDPVAFAARIGTASSSTTTSTSPDTASSGGVVTTTTTTTALAPSAQAAGHATTTTSRPGQTTTTVKARSATTTSTSAKTVTTTTRRSTTTTTTTTTVAAATTTTSHGSAPNARGDNFTVSTLVPITLDVLANDTDPDNDLDPTTLSITVFPTHGLAAVTSGGVGYLNLGQSDELTYRICDHAAHCATARVSLTTK